MLLSVRILLSVSVPICLLNLLPVLVALQNTITIVYHTIENAMTNTINTTYARGVMGRLDVIPSNIQRLSCILIGCIFSGHGINCRFRSVGRLFIFYLLIYFGILLLLFSAFNASAFVGFFFLAILVIGGVIFLVLCCKDRKYLFGSQRQEQPAAMTVAVPDIQLSAPVSSQPAELAFPQLEESAVPGCASPLQVQLETAYLPYVGEPPPPYPGI